MKLKDDIFQTAWSCEEKKTARDWVIVIESIEELCLSALQPQTGALVVICCFDNWFTMYRYSQFEP